MRVAAAGGRPVRIGEARGAGGSTWLDDGTIVLAPIYSDGLFRMSAEGGNLTRLTTPDRDAGVLGHWWPDQVPGGRWVLFTAFRTPVDTSRVGAVDLVTGEARWLVDGGFFGRYVSTGHLLYAKGQRLYAVPFDAATATVRGAAVTVLDDLLVEQTGGVAMLAVSRRGTLAFVSESLGHVPTELVWIDRAGQGDARGRRAQPLPHRQPLARRAARRAHRARGESRPLGPLVRARHAVAADERRRHRVRPRVDRPTATSSSTSSTARRSSFIASAVGTPDAGRPIWNKPAELDTDDLPAVAPDGRTLVFCLTEEGTGSNLYARPLDGGEPRAFRASRGQELFASFSPDGVGSPTNRMKPGARRSTSRRFQGRVSASRSPPTAGANRAGPPMASSSTATTTSSASSPLVSTDASPSNRHAPFSASRCSRTPPAAPNPASTTSAPTASASWPSPPRRRCGRGRSTSSPTGRPSSFASCPGARHDRKQQRRSMRGPS
jgi:hypothetical protein